MSDQDGAQAEFGTGMVSEEVPRLLEPLPVRPVAELSIKERLVLLERLCELLEIDIRVSPDFKGIDFTQADAADQALFFAIDHLVERRFPPVDER